MSLTTFNVYMFVNMNKVMHKGKTHTQTIPTRPQGVTIAHLWQF